MSFLTARFVRLWPGLAFCALLTVLAGVFVKSAPTGSYLGGDTVRFVLSNLTFTLASYRLTGVECGGETCVLNGSLCTLPWEVRCSGAARHHEAGGVSTHPGRRPGLGAVYLLDTIDRLWVALPTGVAAYLLRERMPLSWRVLRRCFSPRLQPTL